MWENLAHRYEPIQAVESSFAPSAKRYFLHGRESNVVRDSRPLQRIPGGKAVLGADLSCHNGMGGDHWKRLVRDH